jgi:predicted membrane-bound spermidine synthase
MRFYPLLQNRVAATGVVVYRDGLFDAMSDREIFWRFCQRRDSAL